MKRIELTKGLYATVDDEDYDALNQFRWYADKGRGTYYAGRPGPGPKYSCISMHRQIMCTPDNMVVDHINSDGLDNQRHNLRNCTTAQNNVNSNKKPHCSSIYKGVCFDKGRNQWAAYIGREYKIGRFSTEYDAALAYNKKAVELYGEFARLNVIPMQYQIRIKPLYEDTILPKKAYDGDAAYDVFNYSSDRILITGERFKFPLGFAMELPNGYVGLIQGKSGLSVNNGITTIGNVIDSTYRGQCHATLLNTGNESVTIRRGQKIAQMLIIPCYTGKDYEIVDELSETDRGTDGFGSTGLEAIR